MCFSSSTCISPRKANPNSIRRRRSVSLNSKRMSPSGGLRESLLLGYVEHCRKRLDAVMAGMTEAWLADPCPFPYLAMSNGELLLYNMRHVQHHAAQLNMRLRQATDSAPDWVSKGGRTSRSNITEMYHDVILLSSTRSSSCCFQKC